MKRLTLLFICCCLPLLGTAKEHAYGIGNWIRDEHLEVGKVIVIDYGYAEKLTDEQLLPEEKKEGFVVFWGDCPAEDTYTVYSRKEIDDKRSKMIPKDGGVVIDLIYVRLGKEEELADKLRPSSEPIVVYSEELRKQLSQSHPEELRAHDNSKRIDVVLAKVGQRWVVVYQ